MRRPSRLLVRAAALAGTAALLAPAVADAHGLVGRQDLPIPRWLFAWGAAVVLVASFVALAVLWREPLLEHPTERLVLRVPAALDVLAGALGVAAFVLVVWAGYDGTQTATANLAPTTIYVIFWVGLPVLSLLLGDVFRAINPWLAIARAARWMAGRLRGGELPEPMPYPAWLGRWPAALGILCFAWVELVYHNRDDPSTLASLALAYAAIQLVGMSLYGIETWSRRADAFGVYFGLFSLMSGLHWRERALYVRRWLSGLTELDPVPGTVGMLAVMIGTTSFDGLSQGQIWSGPDGLGQRLQRSLVDRGFTPQTGLEIAFTIGLVAMVCFVGALFYLGVRGMRTVGTGHETTELARRFVHSLVPIALAYVVAHYFSLLAYQGQAVAYLASDPLGDGSDLFGTAGQTVDYSIITATGIWYVQVAALVVGHVAGLTLAHDRALVVYDRVRDATRSQYWMLAVMVGFTSLGLWLLSASAQ
jgi:hypothetical protein